MRHGTLTNTAFSTEIGRKVSCATRKESKRFSLSVKLHKITQNYTFFPMSVEKAVFVYAQWRVKN